MVRAHVMVVPVLAVVPSLSTCLLAAGPKQYRVPILVFFLPGDGMNIPRFSYRYSPLGVFRISRTAFLHKAFAWQFHILLSSIVLPFRLVTYFLGLFLVFLVTPLFPPFSPSVSFFGWATLSVIGSSSAKVFHVACVYPWLFFVALSSVFR